MSEFSQQLLCILQISQSTNSNVSEKQKLKKSHFTQSSESLQVQLQFGKFVVSK